MDHLPVGIDTGPEPRPAPDSSKIDQNESSRPLKETSNDLQELSHAEPVCSYNACVFHQCASDAHVLDSLKTGAEAEARDGRCDVLPASDRILNGSAIATPNSNRSAHKNFIISDDGGRDCTNMQTQTDVLLNANVSSREPDDRPKRKCSNGAIANGARLAVNGDADGAPADSGSSSCAEQDGLRAWFVCATALLNYAIGTRSLPSLPI